MSRRVLIGGLSCVLLAAGLAGCLDELNKPKPPDTLAPVAAFDRPTGRLGQVPFSDLLAAIATISNVVQALCGWDPIANLSCLMDQTCSGCILTDLFLRALRSVLPSIAGEADGGVGGIAGVNGFVEVHQICPGFLDPPVPDPSNGFGDYTIGFTGYGLDPILWGTVTACQFPLLGQDLTFDGTLVAYYPERVPFDRIESTPVLLGFLGSVDDGVQSRLAAIALRTRPDGQGTTELLVQPAGEGSFVFVISPEGVYVEAADGRWSCNVVTETCELVAPL